MDNGRDCPDSELGRLLFSLLLDLLILHFFKYPMKMVGSNRSPFRGYMAVLITVCSLQVWSPLSD